MLRAPTIARRTGLLAATLLVILPCGLGRAAAIDVSLNLIYSDPASAASGGTWQVVAKSDGFGLAGLNVLLTNIATAQNTGPRGIVNDADPAGFGVFSNAANPMGFNEITIGQAPLPPASIGPGEEQSVFYGVGTLVNGAPNYPGKPPASPTLGPAFTTLSNVNGVPWATSDVFNDPVWATAAQLASGNFAAGVSPSFFQSGENFTRGTTFTSLGNSTDYGTISTPSITASTIVRTNLMTMITADYNDNGVVDAADFVLWRKTLGSTTELAADGNNNGMIDQPDYEFWRTNFGMVVGAGSGAAQAASLVPEPASMILLIIGAVAAVVLHRSRDRRSGFPAV